MVCTKAYGIKPHELDWSCPAEIEPYLDAYEYAERKFDEHAWLQGLYINEATTVAIENCFAGKKSKAKYPKKPYSTQVREQNGEMSHEEKMKKVEALFMRLDIMKANYDLSHRKKDGD